MPLIDFTDTSFLDKTIIINIVENESDDIIRKYHVFQHMVKSFDILIDNITYAIYLVILENGDNHYVVVSLTSSSNYDLTVHEKMEFTSIDDLEEPLITGVRDGRVLYFKKDKLIPYEPLIGKKIVKVIKNKSKSNVSSIFTDDNGETYTADE